MSTGLTSVGHRRRRMPAFSAHAWMSPPHSVLDIVFSRTVPRSSKAQSSDCALRRRRDGALCYAVHALFSRVRKFSHCERAVTGCQHLGCNECPTRDASRKFSGSRDATNFTVLQLEGWSGDRLKRRCEPTKECFTASLVYPCGIAHRFVV